MNDRELREEIETRLGRAYLIDPEEISVTVNDGVVTLEGTCDQWELARMIHGMVEQVPEVKEVETRVRVRMTGGGPKMAQLP